MSQTWNELKSWQEEGKNCCVITMSQKSFSSKLKFPTKVKARRPWWLGWSWDYHLGQYSYTYTTKTFDTLGEVVYDCTTHGKCTCGAAAAPQNPFLLWQIGDHFCDMFSSTNEKRVSWYFHNSQNIICTTIWSKIYVDFTDGFQRKLIDRIKRKLEIILSIKCMHCALEEVYYWFKNTMTKITFCSAVT